MNQLHYELAGKGPEIVLVVPGAFDCRIWQPQWEALRDRFRLLRYDPRGWGRSPKAKGPFSHIEDLARLMDHVSFDRAHVIGSSFGGSLALDLAVARPDRVSSLVLVGAGGPQNGFPVPEELPRAFAPVAAAMREDFAKGIDTWLELDERMPRDATLRKLVRENALENESYWRIDPRWPEALDPPAAVRLDGIQAPTLVMVGENDHPYTHGIAEKLERGIPNARRLVVEGAGHLVHLEKPDSFNRIVEEFVQ